MADSEKAMYRQLVNPACPSSPFARTPGHMLTASGNRIDYHDDQALGPNHDHGGEPQEALQPAAHHGHEREPMLHAGQPEGLPPLDAKANATSASEVARESQDLFATPDATKRKSLSLQSPPGAPERPSYKSRRTHDVVGHDENSSLALEKGD